MMRFLTLALLVLVLAAPASAQDRREPRLRPAANPSAVIARELEFAQAAQDKGQWTAFREFASEDAVMFVPQAVFAQEWLRNRTNPAVSVTWQPAEVWSSCDGSLVVSQGAWQCPDSVGYFTTIWERQRDGPYMWVLDHETVLDQPRILPEMIPGHVAECPASGRPSRLGSVAGGNSPDLANLVGRSRDGTMTWSAIAAPDGSQSLKIEWRQDGAMQLLMTEQLVAPGTRD
jgi:hypothetical protein